MKCGGARAPIVDRRFYIRSRLSFIYARRLFLFQFPELSLPAASATAVFHATSRRVRRDVVHFLITPGRVTRHYGTNLVRRTYPLRFAYRPPTRPPPCPLFYIVVVVIIIIVRALATVNNEFTIICTYRAGTRPSRIYIFFRRRVSPNDL